MGTRIVTRTDIIPYRLLLIISTKLILFAHRTKSVHHQRAKSPFPASHPVITTFSAAISRKTSTQLQLALIVETLGLIVLLYDILAG